MGHYYAEMFPNGEDHTFYQRYADYQRKCGIEIDKIIEKNPIRLEEISIGDKLTIYEPLKGLSKIRFDNEGEFHKIRELFDCRAKYYGWSFWALAHADDFTCYDKRIQIVNFPKAEHSLIRISSPPKQVGKYPPIDWVTFQHWVSPKFFQKK